MPIMQQFSSAVNNNSTGCGNNYNKHKNTSNNNLHTPKMQTAKTSSTTPSPSASPPEFDFNLPCRYFKSSFARSLSLNNGGNQCKSLDFDIGGHYRSLNACSNNSIAVDTKSDDCPPLPQRTHAGTPAAAVAATATKKSATSNVKNEVERSDNNANANADANKLADAAAAADVDGDTKPPAIPARCPIKPAPVAAARDMQLLQQQRQQQQQQQQLLAQFRNAAVTENANASAKPKPLPHAVPAAAAACGNFNKPINHTQQQQVNNNNNKNGSNSICGGRNHSHSRSHTSNIRRNIWPRDEVPSQQAGRASCNAADEGSTTGAATPNYGATTAARNMPAAKTTPAIATTTTTTTTPFKTHENTVNVEVVVLQNQVDTLQWQLKQVETSCDMYRAVIEEVARFLDRYHSQKQQQQQQQQQQRQQQLQQNRNGMEQISRSKSLYQVYGAIDTAAAAGGAHENNSPASGDEASATTAYLRARSSTNLATPETATRHATLAADRNNYAAITPANSYTAFKDFTWRRSPKKQSESKAIAAAADLEEKLNQEAFRLSRTIHNLLNTSTQQPDLTQHRNQLATSNLSRFGCNNIATPTATPTNCSSTVADNNTPTTLATANTNANTIATSKTSSSLAAEMLFLRSNNMRDSRLSLRSSTDSSVHSTTSSSAASSSSSSSSSSKLETDEEATPHFHSVSFMASKQLHHPLGSATEDESGFSSISSFQDIGVPLSSTLLSNGSSTPSRHSLASVKQENSNQEAEHNPDSRNSTLKATPPTFGHTSAHPTNVVGVPLQAKHDMQHRWDPPLTPTKTYRNAGKYQRFSTLSNEESATVLWV